MEHDDKSITVWTENDHRRGWCRADQVGKPLEEDPLPMLDAPPTPAPGPTYQPMTRAERKVKLQSVVDKIIHYADAHPEAMLDDNGAQINKLMDLFSKMDEREEEKTPTLGKLSDADLANMSITDLKRVLIDVVMNLVPVDKQADAMQTLRR